MNRIKQRLLELGQEKASHPEKYRVHLLKNKEANNLINDIRIYPHAYVLACLMDRQVKAEKALELPYRVKYLLKTFKVKNLLASSESFYINLFQKNKLHRLSKEIGKVFFLGIMGIQDEYGGDASRIWRNRPSSATVVRRFLQSNGCGIKIATLAAKILVRQYDVDMSDKSSIDVSPDVHVQRTMKRPGLISKNSENPTSAADRNKARETIIYLAREINPEYPGIIDYALWDIGRNICRPQNPQCDICELADVCSQYM